MQQLTVVIVGLDLVDIVVNAAKMAGLMVNPVNQVNPGKFGNFKTLTYIFNVDDDKLITKRRDFMNELAQDRRFIIPVYEHGDWTSVYILKRWAFQDDE